MLKLLKIDFIKNYNYRSFWVLTGLYFVLMGIVAASGMEFLKWLKSLGADFEEFDPMRIPLYHFPDIWQNLLYMGTYFKFILAIVIIISITNEFSYKTIKQNIIDGMSRMDFLKSKVATIFVLSASATIFITLIILITGLIYSDPDTKNLSDIFTDTEFILAFFLNLFGYLLFALLVGMIVRRSGLSIGLLFLYSVMIENIIIFNLPSSLDAISDFFPMSSLGSLIDIPYKKYIFMEIRDYLAFSAFFTVLAYISLYFYLNFRLLRGRDL